MENNKYNRAYLKMPVSELLELVRTHKITGKAYINYSLMDEDWYEALINHLHERDLTPEERIIFDQIMSSDTATLITAEKQIELIKEKEHKSMLPEKYPALRTIAGFFKLLAWIVGIVAVIAAVLLASKGGDFGILISVIVIVIGAIILLGLLAISESIMVLIDIEHNTRQKSKTN